MEKKEENISSKKVPMELKKSAMPPKKPPLLSVEGSVGGCVAGSVGSVGSVGGSVASPVAGAKTVPQTVQI